MSDSPIANCETGLVLSFVGDVMPGRKVARSLSAIGLDESARRVRRLLEGCGGPGLAVGNLECPLSSAMPAEPFKPDGGPNLHAAPEMAGWLAKAGFWAVSLANNHMLDCGQDGLTETLEALEKSGIRTVGAGRTLQQAHRPLVLERAGLRVGIMAFGNGRPGHTYGPSVCPFRSQALRRAFKLLPGGLDAVIVLMHSGLELLEHPESWNRQFAQEALALGANVVLAGHSHCMRGIRRSRDGFVAFGLGDFLMDTADPEHLRDHLARTALTKLGFAPHDPLICREGLIVRIGLAGGGVAGVEAEPLLVGDDFLPDWPAEGQAHRLQTKLRQLSAELADKDCPAMLRVKAIEAAHRARYGSGRRWRDWLSLPLRIRPSHLRRLLGGQGA